MGKAEWLEKGGNPRFIVSNLPRSRAGKQALYKELYCAREDMENRIKEQQLDLFVDRTSTATMAANQLRLYFSSFAYVLLAAVRRLALEDTSKARFQCGTLRLRFLKIAARIRITHRRIWIHLSNAFPWQNDYAQALANLQRKPSITRRPEAGPESRHHNTAPRIDSTPECARRPPGRADCMPLRRLDAPTPTPQDPCRTTDTPRTAIKSASQLEPHPDAALVKHAG